MSNKGFTFLELLIVMGIMVLVAAMIWPVQRTLDDNQREKITWKKIQEIEDAILGHSEIVDSYDLDRSIGGYVRDMCQGQDLSQTDEWCDWPGLWEPGEPGESLGGKRGEFASDRFRWKTPFVKVGDPKKESMGQPRGLWTRQLNSVPLPSQRWQGPYITPPVTTNPALSRHFAENQDQYDDLHGHDREYFHLLQGQDQLLDGWNRAYRFFITDAGETFTIVSLGRDGQAEFPNSFENYDPGHPLNQDNIVYSLRFNKSEWQNILRSQRLRSRTVERLIIMTEDYMDRIVRALVGDAPSGPNTGYTGDLLDWPDLWNYVCRFDRNNTPSEPFPCNVCRDADNNIGYVGVTDCADYPEGEWEPAFNADDYTYGQPRGLWDQGDLADSGFGIGWRHAYHHKPENSSGSPDVTNEKEVLRDAWDRPLLFFKVEDNGKEHLMIVSAGESGSGVLHRADPNLDNFVFPQPEFAGNPETEFDDYLAKRKETFDLADYQPDFQDEIDGITYNNKDNIVRLVRLDDWQPGFMDLKVSLDVDLGGVTNQQDCEGHQVNDYQCRVYGLDGSPVYDDENFQADWIEDPDNPGQWLCQVDSLRFKFDDKTVTGTIISGGRYLVCWDSSDDKDDPELTDWNRIFSVFANPARIVDREILLKMSDF
jgi:prepilin-type N-terminal cleavage/methylation domain-containing protein